MKHNGQNIAALSLLALIFTIGLTFAAVELPRLADRYLQQQVSFPRLSTGQDTETAEKTRLYLGEYHLRTIGYAALGIVVLLIIAGFATRKKGLASAGALLLFLPVFGHFAATMFFLGGLGFLRLIWLPFLDISFDLMRLGDAVLVPYRGLLVLFSSLGVPLNHLLPLIITGTGFFIFMLGTLAWLRARVQKKPVADTWVYRFSRHPQYLGWIVWSYGIMLLPGVNMKRSYEISSTLPWLLSAMIIIGIALFEERNMTKRRGAEYFDYQRKTPFLFPLPVFLIRLIKMPLGIFFGKPDLSKKKQIATLLLFYTGLLILLSAFTAGIIGNSERSGILSSERTARILQRIKTADSRLVIREQLAKLARSGDSALTPLLSLLEEKEPIIRWYTIDLLADFSDPRITERLIQKLHDPDRWVRRAAAGALGRIGSPRAVLPLIEALRDPDREIVSASARALGAIGDPRAILPLTDILLKGSSRDAGAAAQALGALGNPTSVPILIQRLEKPGDCPCVQIGQALRTLGSDRAIDAFRAGLQDDHWWIRGESLRGLAALHSPAAIQLLIEALRDSEARVRQTAVWILGDSGSPAAVTPLAEMLEDPDFEVRLYAREALRKLQNPVPADKNP